MSISNDSTYTPMVSHFSKTQEITKAGSTGSEDEENLTQECRELLLSLPRERGLRTPFIYKFQGFWCQPKQIQSIISFQKHFQARDTDIILATIPKSGTTWLKALVFATLKRKSFNPSNTNNHPLLVSNPHDLVPFFEYKVYNNQVPDLSGLPEPRIFATHVPFASLQQSIKTTKCRIVYICRNPFDTFISSWIYLKQLKPESLPDFSLEEAFDMYCRGVIGYGPFWDHMLGFWKESLERPDKVLFLKYEDLKEDITSHLKKLAKFLGFPFADEEERSGLIEDIAKLCSFEKLKDLEVNKSGKSILNAENRHLFRKGEVGDWRNHLSPSMVEKLAQVMEEKLGGSGLQFQVMLQNLIRLSNW